MFLEFQTLDSGVNRGFGLDAFAHLLHYVLTNDTAARTAALSTAITGGLAFLNEWSTENPGGWVRRELNSSSFFNSSTSSPGLYWAWSQPVQGKPDQAFYHKGFAIRWNERSSGVPNYFNGFMGSFQDFSNRTAFAPFDFARPLNVNLSFGSTSGRFDTLNAASIFSDRYVFAAGQGYMFIGNITQATFWAVVDATTLPIHEYPGSSAIPMVGLSGLGVAGSSNVRHDLHVSVHKYDSGAGATFNQLSSFTQMLNSDSATAINTQQFLRLYPQSLAAGLPDRFDEDGKRSPAIYPIILGNPILGNAYQTVEGLVLVSGQNHETGQTFYIGPTRYYKFVCTHERANRTPATASLTIGIPVR
jgi:hypothetical protein